MESCERPDVGLAVDRDASSSVVSEKKAEVGKRRRAGLRPPSLLLLPASAAVGSLARGRSLRTGVEMVWSLSRSSSSNCAKWR